MKDYIIVDRRVAQAFIHHSNHLNCQFVDPAHRDLKIKMIGLKDMSVGEIVDQAKARVDRLAGYFKNALSEETPEVKIKLDVDKTDIYINNWLSKEHGFKYDGTLSRKLAQALAKADIIKVKEERCVG